MPTYDYRCEACGHRLEAFQSFSEAPKRKCPKCRKQKLERLIGAGAGILFKGGGFYQTDYRSDSYRKGESAEKGNATPAADTQSAGDTKSADAKSAENNSSAAPASAPAAPAAKPAAKDAKRGKKSD